MNLDLLDRLEQLDREFDTIDTGIQALKRATRERHRATSKEIAELKEEVARLKLLLIKAYKI